MVSFYYRGAIESILVHVNKAGRYWIPFSYYRKDMQSILVYCGCIKIETLAYFLPKSIIPLESLP